MSCAPADVRRIALALPEAYEDTHRGRPTFRVKKRIFASLGAERPGAGQGFYAPLSGARPVVSLTLDREDQLNLAAAHPEAVVAAGRYGFCYVWLDEVAPDALELMLRMSWARAAPKRLLR
ncbi:MAG TPA: MmcQ/YjbR family DNA-binding protein [Phenylobacterium sp.]|uniref:MmcQ/YjbR family DNA-binding protein n=1 Tax=Phenylobacterium sp. TaxID=1871053 RepID=UPI002BBFCA5A|nr:MmcQ/YjbR family DNA-binding protein [Phenylobacterium sp.]HSV02171.1 MmcQ/YjbR family DNA-binding protein [Phenylobacterium sp.]